MFELFNRYAQLKTMEEEREERRKDLKAELALRLKDVDAEYPTLDKEIEQVRGVIQGEVNAQPEKIVETDYGKAEIQFRTSWEVWDGYGLSKWLDEKDRSGLYDYTFKKAEVNKICAGLDLAGMPLPTGTKKIETPTLVITLNDTER